MKVTDIVLLAVIVIILAVFGIYWYRNIHWYDKYEKALDKLGAREKRFTLKNGNLKRRKRKGRNSSFCIYNRECGQYE